jgi:hypothetical protein
MTTLFSGASSWKFFKALRNGESWIVPEGVFALTAIGAGGGGGGGGGAGNDLANFGGPHWLPGNPGSAGGDTKVMSGSDSLITFNGGAGGTAGTTVGASGARGGAGGSAFVSQSLVDIDSTNGNFGFLGIHRFGGAGGYGGSAAATNGGSGKSGQSSHQQGGSGGSGGGYFSGSETSFYTQTVGPGVGGVGGSVSPEIVTLKVNPGDVLTAIVGSGGNGGRGGRGTSRGAGGGGGGAGGFLFIAY